MCDTHRAVDSVVTFSACVSSARLLTTCQAAGFIYETKALRRDTFNYHYTHSYYTPALIKHCQDVFNLPTLVINELLHTVSPFRDQRGKYA